MTLNEYLTQNPEVQCEQYARNSFLELKTADESLRFDDMRFIAILPKERLLFCPHEDCEKNYSRFYRE